MTGPHRFLPRLGIVAIVGFGGLIASSVGVRAEYPPAIGTAAISSSCTAVSPGGTCGVGIQFLNPDGTPVVGGPVTFGVSGCGSVSPVNATTNTSGVAATTFRAVCGGSACGPAIVSGTMGGAGGASTRINVLCAVGGAFVPLPATSAGMPSGGGLAFLVAGLSALVLAAVVVAMRTARPRSRRSIA